MFVIVIVDDDDDEDNDDSEDSVVDEKLEISNNCQQSTPYCKSPPLFVGESNEIMILLPSDENNELIIKGPFNSSSTPFTTKSSPEGNETW